MNFVKLNHQHSFYGIEAGRVLIKYGIHDNNKFNGIYYNDIRNKYNFINAFDVIPRRYREDFFLVQLIATSVIPPHTDSDTKATINFYIDTGNYTTKFYKFKNKVEASSYKLPTQTDGSIFFEHDLEVVNSFDAEPNDIYLLNVAVPHGVIANSNTNSSVIRNVLSLQTNLHSFDAVLEMLKETNSI
jgi:hypothetical protein